MTGVTRVTGIAGIIVDWGVQDDRDDWDDWDDNNNNIRFICMTIIIQLQYCKSFNIKLQFTTMIMQCNDYCNQ